MLTEHSFCLLVLLVVWSTCFGTRRAAGKLFMLRWLPASQSFVARQTFYPGISSTALSFVSSTRQPLLVQKKSSIRRAAANPTYSQLHGNSTCTTTMTVASLNGQDIKPGARLIPATPEGLESCGARLRQGDLVAFPTETVYGLGCHALDETAIPKVFQAKERPLTDPLIVHVAEASEAFSLWNADPESLEYQALQALCDTFWPGPLTLVAKSTSNVPSILMAGTGYVACRSPAAPLARLLLKAARVPVAAPSANKFGHVSPTRAQHVWDDLQNENVWILHPESSQDVGKAGEDREICKVGVESTVAKIEMVDESHGRIILLRQGAVSVTDIAKCLKNAPNNLNLHFAVNTETKKTAADHVATVAPGQSIRHYSPHIPSFMLAQSLYFDQTPGKDLSEQAKEILSTSVVIDYGARLSGWEPPVSLAYRDLSPNGISGEAAQSLFEVLRWAEQIPGSRRILFPQLSDDQVEMDALEMTLMDKLMRASSGVCLTSFSDL